MRAVFDNAGVVTNSIDYDAFGGFLGGVPVDRYAFTGREWDSDIGLQYNRARMYSPDSGRWMSEDPIGFAAGDANLMRYVGNGPTNGSDPSGHYVVVDRSLGAFASFLDFFLANQVKPGLDVSLQQFFIEKGIDVKYVDFGDQTAIIPLNPNRIEEILIQDDRDRKANKTGLSEFDRTMLESMLNIYQDRVIKYKYNSDGTAVCELSIHSGSFGATLRAFILSNILKAEAAADYIIKLRGNLDAVQPSMSATYERRTRTSSENDAYRCLIDGDPNYLKFIHNRVIAKALMLAYGKTLADVRNADVWFWAN